MIKNNVYRTAESVSPGHPDSFMDYIVNSILDEYLKEDPNSRVAIDGVCKADKITLGGEITSNAFIDIEPIIHKCIKDVGYDFFPEIVLHIYNQSQDIALGTNDEVKGAGDQGTITGYACKGNKRMIPLEKALADEIITTMFSELRTHVPKIKSDMKCQVTLYYQNNEPIVDTVVIACQHEHGFDSEDLASLFIPMCEVIFDRYEIPEDNYLNCNYIVNGTGQFIIGGPEADSGEVGRKIVVDSYGVSVPVGGGTYNGKDATKVDRSAAYYARYVAKNIVAANLADECLITVAYCIGKREPISIDYNFFGTAHINEQDIIDAANKLFDFTPANMISELQLTKPIFATAGLICHFGLTRKQSLSSADVVTIPWEQTEKSYELLSIIHKGN